MALVVENGTGGDALISLADFKTYATNKGYVYSPTFSDTQIEQAIRRASLWVSTTYNFKGYTIGGRAQIQAWPRYNVETSDGWYVDSTTIPREVSWATAEATWYELNNPNALSPVETLTDRVVSETVGPISVTYAQYGSDVSAGRPYLLIVSELLAPLLVSNSNAYTTKAIRG
jgi:hypothetical protein